MNLSICINTCALGPRATFVTGSCSPTPHAIRAHMLRNAILPALVEDPDVDEVIVVGEWEEGEGYTYVHEPSRFFSCVDALAQRQAGFEASTGDVVAFLHDDHMLGVGMPRRVMTWAMRSDVFVPRRLIRRGGGVDVLNNGSGDGYVGGHATFYTRDVLERAPWGDVPKVHTWDVEHTAMLRRAGARIEWSEDVVVYDVEVGGG